MTHDLTPAQWHAYLQNLNSEQTGDPSPPVRVFQQAVNYYRLPDVIRIEGKYDEIRKATYGELLYIEGPDIHRYFFWVDSVRLVKASSTETAPRQDVVELTIANDIWSNKFTDCQLYDSYVVRRHVDRWEKENNTCAEVYRPDAFDEVGGFYSEEYEHTLCDLFVSGDDEWKLRFFIVCSYNNVGQMSYAVGGFAVDKQGNETEIKVLVNQDMYRLMNAREICYGDRMVSLLGLSSVDMIRSILCFPTMRKLRQAMTLYEDPQTHELFPMITMSQSLYDAGWAIKTSAAQVPGVIALSVTGTTDPADQYKNTIFAPSIGWGGDNVPHPDRGANPTAGQTYSDAYEPMLFRYPARQRKVVSSMGGSIIDVPDFISYALGNICNIQNIIDFENGYVLVYSGYLNGIAGPIPANLQGYMGVLPCPSLPIASSAWKQYQAIQKMGDDIAYNAKQVQAAVNIATGSLGGAAVGMMTTGNPAGALAGGLGGALNGAVGMWANSELLEAKRETIKNSPAVVHQGSSGFGALILGYFDIYMVMIKIDDTSFDKLRTQYYYYGYNINAMQAGTIDTKTRLYFDYIETRGARIRGDVNAEEAEGIAAVFDKGVRIYHGADGYKEIGVGVVKENSERSILE